MVGRAFCDESIRQFPTNTLRRLWGLQIHVLEKMGYVNELSLHEEIVEVEIEVVSPSIDPSGNFAELNRNVTCMVLKPNDRRTSCPCRDEFRGPRSDYVRQVASENNKQQQALQNIIKDLFHIDVVYFSCTKNSRST
ncbi:hypothetical protein TNCV_4578011 [Trichonephila clavipes]|nr:hypothetical protein TNCV_4578011 [Trichonephila clavipes]